MWWANNAALELWNADTLESLLSRNFADDMSEATERRLADDMEKFKKQERVTAQVSLHGLSRAERTCLKYTCLHASVTFIVDVLPRRQRSNDCRCTAVWNICRRRPISNAE
jgi:hypothetical protein